MISLFEILNKLIYEIIILKRVDIYISFIKKLICSYKSIRDITFISIVKIKRVSYVKKGLLPFNNTLNNINNK